MRHFFAVLDVFRISCGSSVCWYVWTTASSWDTSLCRSTNDSHNSVTLSNNVILFATTDYIFWECLLRIWHVFNHKIIYGSNLLYIVNENRDKTCSSPIMKNMHHFHELADVTGYWFSTVHFRCRTQHIKWTELYWPIQFSSVAQYVACLTSAFDAAEIYLDIVC